jgi:hypothetical protein
MGSFVFISLQELKQRAAKIPNAKTLFGARMFIRQNMKKIAKPYTPGPYDCLWDFELKRICRNHVVAAYHQGRYRSWALYSC